jgi:hypothetical protein
MENVDYLDWLVEHNILRNCGSAWAMGYFWRTVPSKVEPYHGRYGHGYKVHSATRRSTYYHPVTYYVWTEPEYESYRDFIERGMKGVA